jgi:hypothetical protein
MLKVEAVATPVYWVAGQVIAPSELTALIAAGLADPIILIQSTFDPGGARDHLHPARRIVGARSNPQRRNRRSITARSSDQPDP